MKSVKRLSRLSAAIVLVGAIFLAAPIAMAATDTTTKTTTTTPTTTKQATAKPAAKIADRLANYKTKQAVKLAAAEETKLKGVCKNAQTKLKTTSTNTNNANTERAKNYAAVTKQLENIIAKLKDSKIDTKELEANLTAFKALVQQYNDDYAVYKTDLADVSELDCVTDPTAFKAALLAARQDRLTVVNDATAIREYITSIKLSLIHVRVQITAAQDNVVPKTTNTAETQGTN